MSEPNYGTFQYTIATVNYNENEEPIINTDSSFVLNKTTFINGLDTLVSYYYEYISISSNDGLYLNGTITTTENMKINDFSNIPLSRQGSQFLNYSGYFPDDSANIPVLLSNTIMISNKSILVC